MNELKLYPPPDLTNYGQILSNLDAYKEQAFGKDADNSAVMSNDPPVPATSTNESTVEVRHTTSTEDEDEEDDLSSPSSPSSNSAGYVESDLVIALPGDKFETIDVGKARKIKRTLDENPEFEPLEVYIPLNPFERGYPPFFKPIAIYSVSDELWKGMIPVYPVVLGEHYVTVEAWVQFMEDILLCSRIPFSAQKLGTYMSLFVWGGYQWHKYLLKTQGRDRYDLVKERVELWNEGYFQKRKVRVLFQGPDDISSIRERQQEEFRAKKKNGWEFLRKNYTKVRTKDKSRLVVMSL